MMHDCRVVQERLIDLLFKELREDEAQKLLVRIESCAECQEQYRSMSLTLFAFDQATGSIMPEENFWTAYHERLASRIEEEAAQGAAGERTADAASVEDATGLRGNGYRVPFWKRFAGASVTVPAPLAALALLVLAASSLFALRQTTRDAGAREEVQKLATASDSSPTAASSEERTIEKTRIVEVPVVQERVVTRTVYVARNGRAQKNEEQRTVDAFTAQTRGVEEGREDSPAHQQQNSESLPLANASAAEPAPNSTARAESRHAALAGFKPAGEVKLRIIKGPYRDEK